MLAESECLISIIFYLSLNSLITRIKSLGSQNTAQSEYNIIFLAKLLRSFTEICPHVKQCLMPTSLLLSNTWNETNVSNIEHWERICRLLNEESINLWKKWIKSFVSDCLHSNNELCFSIDIALHNLLDLFPNWETYSIEEKDESNESVQSIIRVPAHPSIPLQRFLFDCCKQLNQRIPETLPKPVTILLTENLLGHIIDTYKELSENNEFIASNQNASLQLYFDIKFVMLLLSNGKRSEQFQKIAATFKAAIDPFDFELFHKYVNANVKFAAQQLHHQYGLLIPTSLNHQALLSTTTKQNTANFFQEKDPNLLALANSGSVHSNWFALLPIVVATKTSTVPNEPTDNKIVSNQTKSEKV